MKKITPDELKQIRINNKLSQEQLAQVMGVHGNYISSLERGVKKISYKFTEKLIQKGLLDQQPEKPSATLDEFCRELDISPDVLKQILQAVSKEPELMSFAAKAVFEKNLPALERFYKILKSEV